MTQPTKVAVSHAQHTFSMSEFVPEELDPPGVIQCQRYVLLFSSQRHLCGAEDNTKTVPITVCRCKDGVRNGNAEDMLVVAITYPATHYGIIIDVVAVGTPRARPSHALHWVRIHLHHGDDEPFAR